MSTFGKRLRGLAALALAFAALPAAAAETKTGYVKTGGLEYYYEISGAGEPLLMLHGGLGSIDMFKPILPAFTAHRQVIAVDLQGHGRTALGKRAFNLPDMGNDMAAILDALGFAQVGRENAG